MSNYGPKQLQRIHKHLTARGVPLASVQVLTLPLHLVRRRWELSSRLQSTTLVESLGPLAAFWPERLYAGGRQVLCVEGLVTRGRGCSGPLSVLVG